MAFLDKLNAWLLLAIACVVFVAYIVRIVLKGRAHFDRVDRQGGSALMSKGLMEMAYWSLQPIARALVSLGVTPNQLSWLSFTFAALCGLCLVFGHFGFGAFFSTISAFLDSLDGMVARMRGMSSDAGEILDAAVDRYAEFFFLGGLAIYYAPLPWLQALALAALAGSFMVSYSTAKAEALSISPPKGSMRRPERAFYLTLGALLSPITIPWFEASRMTPIAIGHPMVFALVLVAVLANASAVERFYAMAVEIRRREAEAGRLASDAASVSVDSEHSSDNQDSGSVSGRLIK